MNFSCYDCSSVPSMTRNDEILMNFDEFIDIHSKPGVQRSSTRKTPDFDRNLRVLLIQLPVEGYKNRVDFVNRFLNPQGGYGQTPLGYGRAYNKIQKLLVKWPFVTTPVTFYVNFPKNHDFDDLGKAVMNILNLMCSNGPGWWIGAQGCLKRGLESSRSILRSKMAQRPYYSRGGIKIGLTL